jgi:hypothetical protein
MKILDEIIDLAVDNSGPLSVLLRKCLLLAHTLKNQRLRTWAEKELDGYDEMDDLPEYRRVRAIAKGYFLGPFHAQINNQPLPPSVLKPEHRPSLQRFGLRNRSPPTMWRWERRATQSLSGHLT